MLERLNLITFFVVNWFAITLRTVSYIVLIKSLGLGRFLPVLLFCDVADTCWYIHVVATFARLQWINPRYSQSRYNLIRSLFYHSLWITLLLVVVIRYHRLRYNYRLLLLVMFDYANYGDHAILGRCYSIWLITPSSAGSDSPAGACNL